MLYSYVFFNQTKMFFDYQLQQSLKGFHAKETQRFGSVIVQNANTMLAGFTVNNTEYS